MKYTLNQTIGMEFKALLCTIQANWLSFVLWLLLCATSIVFIHTMDTTFAWAMVFAVVAFFMTAIIFQRLSVRSAYGKEGTIVCSYTITPTHIEMALGDTFTVKYQRSEVEWSKETNLGLFIKHRRMAVVMLYMGENKDKVKDTLHKHGWIQSRKMSVGRVSKIVVQCLLAAVFIGATIYFQQYLASL